MKRYLVINTEENDLEYTISVEETGNETEYTLRRSGSSAWSEHCRNEVILSIKDDGNGVKIKPKPGKHLDYAELHGLQLLLQFMSKEDKTLKIHYKIVPEKEELITTITL